PDEGYHAGGERGTVVDTYAAEKIIFPALRITYETYGSKSALGLLCSDRKVIRLASPLSTHYGVSRFRSVVGPSGNLGTGIDV
ncbi:MAG: hypothetical protein ACRD9L_22435, partial [Bryobacteraceae bacterium]